MNSEKIGISKSSSQPVGEEASKGSDCTYATVSDYCFYYDTYKELATHQNDLKDVQRPWAVHALLQQLPPPAKVLEIGGGEPIVSSMLASLGYDVTLCDPFDGSGHGSTNFARYRLQYPEITFRRARYTVDLAEKDAANPFDAIISVSVLEHVPEPGLRELFEAIALGLRAGGGGDALCRYCSCGKRHRLPCSAISAYFGSSIPARRGLSGRS